MNLPKIEGEPVIKITILWSFWSGYMDACVRTLVEKHNCYPTIVYRQHGVGAPYAEAQFFNYPCKKVPFDIAQGELPDIVTSEPADVLLINSWDVPAYKKMAARFAGRSLRILCMDNQWMGNLRQRIGTLISSFYVRPYYDTVLLPGRRQAEFARRLGFRDDQIFEGHYACDYEHFSSQYAERKKRPLSHKFLFVGRLVEIKGVATLLDAWDAFVSRSNTDWRLKIIGDGDYVRPGGLPDKVEQSGFVQPSELPRAMLDGDVFISASLVEPWGLVVHEAASTGMPIICTDACGSGDSYVESGKNGFVVERGSVPALLSAFEKITALSDDEIRTMGERSFALASLRTPATWAKVVITMLERHKSSS